ncbi:hypothetical protein DPMN_051082 [Dreissena polymorpha]|uniref:Uncharacterized protein n=1 Tax=Dreissena polymorpha TaxID=45954 RepID=A0A9D4HLU7_DREPO|nr:hypothetical protein DPMN_051082 [Dreissena polymorpha]
MLYGPADSPFFSCLMALRSCNLVLAQNLIDRSLVSCGGFPESCLLSSSWRCSIHLFYCPSSSAFTPPFLSLKALWLVELSCYSLGEGVHTHGFSLKCCLFCCQRL